MVMENPAAALARMRKTAAGTCIVCGAAFVGLPTRQTCSDKCRNVLSRRKTRRRRLPVPPQFAQWVENIPGVYGNEPTIVGTRIPTSILITISVDDFLRDWPYITREQAEGAAAFEQYWAELGAPARKET